MIVCQRQTVVVFSVFARWQGFKTLVQITKNVDKATSELILAAYLGCEQISLERLLP